MLFPAILETLHEAAQSFQLSQSPRRTDLERLAVYLRGKYQTQVPVMLTAVCAQNSRRSFLAQYWATVAAHAAGVPLIAFSGGAEATIMHPNTIATLQRSGAQVRQITISQNPRFRVKYGTEGPEMFLAWSKPYYDPENPDELFALVTVCDEKDKSCPHDPRAEARFALPYEDPKYADGSFSEETAYDRTSRTIAAEMHWLMQQATQP